MFKYIFVSEDVNNEISEYFSSRCYRLVKLNANLFLPRPVSKHADMQLINICDTLVLTLELHHELNISDDIIISYAAQNHSDKYPHDVNLNALLLGEHLLCKVSALDDTVKKICASNAIKTVNVNQGYARCSSLVINDNAVISADGGILKAVDTLGYDTLKISEGYIELPGYDHGFIGGASFYNPQDKQVCFFGDITSHPDYTNISAFCCKHDTDIVSFQGKLTDHGGAVVI